MRCASFHVRVAHQTKDPVHFDAKLLAHLPAPHFQPGQKVLHRQPFGLDVRKQHRRIDGPFQVWMDFGFGRRADKLKDGVRWLVWAYSDGQP